MDAPEPSPQTPDQFIIEMSYGRILLANWFCMLQAELEAYQKELEKERERIHRKYGDLWR